MSLVTYITNYITYFKSRRGFQIDMINSTLCIIISGYSFLSRGLHHFPIQTATRDITIDVNIERKCILKKRMWKGPNHKMNEWNQNGTSSHLHIIHYQFEEIEFVLAHLFKNRKCKMDLEYGSMFKSNIYDQQNATTCLTYSLLMHHIICLRHLSQSFINP